MKPNRFTCVRVAALAIFASSNFFCASCFAQIDPLNSWTTVWTANPLIPQVYGIAYGNGMFVGVGDGARLLSYDGVNWTTYVSPPVINYGSAQPGIAFGAGMFLAFGTNYQNKANYILKSTNGISWTTIYTSSNSLSAAAYGNNTWVSTYPGVTINGTAGAVYQIQSATNLNSAWQSLTNFMLPYSPYIWVDTSSTISGQKFYRSVQLQ